MVSPILCFFCFFLAFFESEVPLPRGKLSYDRLHLRSPFYASDWDAADLFPAFLQHFIYKPNLLQSLASPNVVSYSSLLVFDKRKSLELVLPNGEMKVL